MTTIAYKDGIIAYDSRITQEGTIITDDFDKHVERNGEHFFFTGAPSDLDRFFKAYDGGCQDKGVIPEIYAFVVKNGKIYDCSVNTENIFWECEVTFPLAIGSGCRFALAAMDCGLSAEDAVKLAVKRDIYTGGTIRTFLLDTTTKA